MSWWFCLGLLVAQAADTDAEPVAEEVWLDVGVQDTDDADTDVVDTDGTDVERFGTQDTSVVDTGEPAVVLQDPLDATRFAFCHVEGADADQLGQWCALLATAPPEVCPGMRATCEVGDFSAAPTGCSEGAFGEADGVASAPAEPKSPWMRRDDGSSCESLSCDEPDAASSGFGFFEHMGRWAIAAAVAATLLLLARALWRYLGWGRRPEQPRPTSARVAAVEPVAIEGDDDLPLLPEEALLAQATKALAAGELGEAVVWARGAALRRLARRGRLTLHKARTDREYLRGVRDDAEVVGSLSEVLDAVEAHRWAGRVLTVDTATAAVHAASRLLALATLLLAVFSMPSAHAARRYAPNGDAALYSLLADGGFELADEVRALADLDETVDIVVLDVSAVVLGEEDWVAVEGWVQGGGLLVLGGDPRTFGGPAGVPARWLSDLGSVGLSSSATPTVQVQGIARAAGVSAPSWPQGPTYQWCGARGHRLLGLPESAPRLHSTEDLTAPADCPLPVYAQVVFDELGRVLALSDPDILRNAAMVLPENRGFLPDVLGAGYRNYAWYYPDDPRVLLATRAAGKPPTPVDSLGNARMLPFVGHLMVFWVLLALWRGWPMSPLRAPLAEGRLDFVEHARALGRHWRDRGALRHAASAHARRELSRLGPVALLHAAKRYGWSDARAQAWLDHLEAMAADPDGAEHPDDKPTVEALWKITQAPRS